MRHIFYARMELCWVILLLAALALLVGQTGGGRAASTPGGNRVVIKFSHNQQTSTPPHKAAEMFKQLVEERTHGYYDVQIFPAQQLGGLRDQVEGTILGTIEVTQQTPAIISLFVPKVMILDFPFLWPNNEEAMWQALDGPIGRELLRSLEGKGLKGVDFWSSGFKNVTTGKKPTQSLDDFKGLKIRVIPSPLLSAQYEAWGAPPLTQAHLCWRYVVGRQGNVQIVATHSDRVGWYGIAPGDVGTDAVVQVKAPAVPEAGHRAVVYGSVIEWRTGVRTHIFQGIKLPIVPKNSYIAFSNLKFSPTAFRDILNTGQTDCL